jgi:hypothetical protein
MLKPDRRVNSLLILAACTLVILVGCSSPDEPAKAIERYLAAVVAKDADRAVTSSCADWEDQAHQEVDSFQAVDVTLKDVACSVTEDDGNDKLVTCSGAIIATYNNENREIALDGKSYRAVLEGGEWRMCGYQ